MLLSIISPLYAAPAETVLDSDGIEQALFLDGNDYLEVPHAPELDVSQFDALTIEAWVFNDTGGNSCETIIGKKSVESLFLGLCVNQNIYFVTDGSDGQAGNTIIPERVWTHIAVTWERNGQRRYYINGDADHIGAAGAGIGSNSEPLRIGADRNFDEAPALELNGQLAEVRVWNVAREQDAIRRTMHTLLDEPRPGLVAAWHLLDDFEDSIGENHANPINGARLSTAAQPAPHLLRAEVPIDEQFNTLPSEQHGAAVVTLPERHRALLIGGFRDSSMSDQIDLLDIGTGEVQPFGTLPEPRVFDSAAYAAVNDTVYILGGSPDTGGIVPNDTIFALDPNTGQTRTLSETLPVPLLTPAVFYHPDLHQIYILGGRGEQEVFDTIYRFDPQTETVSGPLDLTLPAARYALTGQAIYAAATDTIYLFSGLDENSGHVDTILAIHIAADGQSGSAHVLESTALPTPDNEFAVVADPISHLIYLVGGKTSEHVLAFDPLSEQLWQTPHRLPDNRTASSLVYDARNRHALLVGGVGPSNTGAVDTIFRIALGDGPALPLGRWDFSTALADNVRAIDGDEQRVLLAASGDVWRIDADGSRFKYNGVSAHDVAYHAPTDEV
jgi:outer membrane protein assembly factor BamB